MPVNIVDVSTFTDPIVAPADSDPADRTYVLTIAQGLANRTRFLNDKYDVVGRVLLPSGAVFDKYFSLLDAVAISGWNTTNSFEWVSTANAAEMVWEIRPHFSPLAVISQIGVLVDPGAARAPGGSYTIGDTMQIELRKSVHVFTVGTPTRTVSTHDTDEDDGTSNLQWAWFNVTGAPTVGSAQSWQVRVKSSVADSDSLPDKVYGLYVKCTVDRIDVT